jgi:hypothetical protein
MHAECKNTIRVPIKVCVIFFLRQSRMSMYAITRSAITRGCVHECNHPTITKARVHTKRGEKLNGIEMV